MKGKVFRNKKDKRHMTKTRAEKFFTGKYNIFWVALCCCILWGSAYPSIKIGYHLFAITDTGEKILFAGYRFTLAGILTLLGSFALRKKISLPEKEKVAGICLLGFIQTFIQYVLFYIGLSHTTGVKASVLNATATFAGVLLAHFFYKNDRMNLQKTCGCIIGFMGIVIINSGQGFGGAQISFLGEGFIILSSLSFAVGSLLSKQISNSGDGMAITGYQLILGGVLLILSGKVAGGQITHITAEGLLLLLYMSMLSAVAFTLWLFLLKYNKMGKITVYNFLVPIFGSLLSGLFLKEDIFQLKNLVALICVSIGIYLVNQVKTKVLDAA